MAKHFTLVGASTPVPKKPCITNWKLCIFCQEYSKSALECPVRCTKASVGSGYRSVAEHLLQFKMIGEIPMNLGLTMAVVLRLH